jgi:HSP20 family protein
MTLKRAESDTESSHEWWPVPMFPLWRSFSDLLRDEQGRRMFAVEEFTQNGTLVVRAELPGIDPDKDVEVTVRDGDLHITAERSEEHEQHGRHFRRREMRYGSFARTIALPDGVDESKVEASYKDGILEVRVPVPTASQRHEPRKVAVTRP